MATIGLGVFENDECAEAVRIALQNGYTHIDSARYYRNEAQVGEGVKQAGKDRSELFITSKVYWTEYVGETALDNTTSSEASQQAARRTVRSAVQDSVEKLKRGLGVDKAYYDLYLLHSPHGGTNARLGAYMALLDEKQEGRIRAAGVSNFSDKHIQEIVDAGLEKPAVNQIELHPFCQQRPIVDYCKKHEIVIQAYSPLVRGVASKFDHQVIRDIASKLEKTPAQVLVRWSLQHGFVPLPKSAREKRIVENAQVYGWEIVDEDMAALDALDEGGKGAVTWNPVDVE
ncbi:Aldo keto reductase [Coniophora puteana RWD-64-598 SS2]|uniref:Aldo keto reductase n=1 Tax=Coniophora puteana (strain RWD-64-598) TaxID=741705 RepID=A0A5M3ME40_CONPW|nr:Aldo keto reductase [Coniophora puteana RWD-64-598 SS2]EIW77498.1 Aldo keto reductase [Coniophora puteana RWD-64-598 SS2]